MKWKNWLKPKSTNNSQSVLEVVEEIHNKFNNAADEALAEANEILGNHKPVEDHVAKLAQLGFTNMPSVRKAADQKRKIQLVSSQAAIIAKYQQKYSRYKYILEHQVDEICKKYNLIMGGVDRYKGEVPKKNVEEIAKFNENKIAIEDMRYTKSYNWREEEIISYEEYLRNRESSSRSIYNYRSVDGYMICAPLKDMEMDKAELKGHRIVEIPDPVVLYPVQFGYLIISKWGIEANDQDLVNEKMN